MKQPACKRCKEPIEWVWNHIKQKWISANPGIVRHTGSSEWVLVPAGFTHQGKPAAAFSTHASKGDPVYVPHRCAPTPKPMPEPRNEEYGYY